jgi:antitoxin FitA
MPTILQVRNIPDELHRRLKARAAMEGMSMSEYVLRELKKSLERPSRAEFLARLAQLPESDLEPSPTSILREEREGR